MIFARFCFKNAIAFSELLKKRYWKRYYQRKNTL